jgi:hypothetical protein
LGAAIRRSQQAAKPQLDVASSAAAQRSEVPVAKVRRNAAAASVAAPWPLAAAQERDGTQARQAAQSQVPRAVP